MASQALTLSDIKKMKVQDLKAELGSRGLDQSGLKADLLQRLEDAITRNTDKVAATPADGVQETANAGGQAGTAVEKNDTVANEAGTDAGAQGKSGSASAANVGSSAQASATGASKTVVTEPAGLSEEERKRNRAVRFGMVPQSCAAAPKQGTEEDKKAARAARFGLPVQNGGAGAAEQEAKLKARAERFGIPPKADPTVAKKAERLGEDVQKMKSRAERFGMADAAADKAALTGAAASSELHAKMEARKVRFGAGKVGAAAATPTGAPADKDELEKRRKREVRFGPQAADDASKKAKQDEKAAS